jgi:hypothetical protein
MDKELLLGDIEAIKFFSMREILAVVLNKSNKNKLNDNEELS